MQKWRKVIAIDVIIAILVILLYSPYQLALTPLDPNFLKAAASVIFAAVLGYEAIKVNGQALLESRASKRLELGDGETTPEDVKLVLAEYKKKPTVSYHAQQGIDQLDAMKRKKESLYQIIGSKFQEESLSWQKFTGVVDAVEQAVIHNTSLLARRIQSFDYKDYNRNVKPTITGIFNRNTIPEDLRIEKRQLYESNLDEMRGIIASNERLLLELDKFAAELGRLESSENAIENSRMLEEIDTLVQQTKYYQ